MIAHRKMHSYLKANGSEHVDLFIITNASKLYNIGEKCIISPAALSNSYSVASVLAFRHANSDENFRLQKTREKEVEADGKLLWIFFTFFRFGSKINEAKSEEWNKWPREWLLVGDFSRREKVAGGDFHWLVKNLGFMGHMINLRFLMTLGTHLTFLLIMMGSFLDPWV